MPEEERKRLDSWKEIAEYLRRDLTTVKRWEKEKGLPVHRLPGGKRQPVFAYRDEIDAWTSGEENNGAPAIQDHATEAGPAPVSEAAQRRAWGKVGHSLAVAVILVGMAAFAFRGSSPSQLRVSSYLPLTNDGRDKDGPLLSDGARVYFTEQGPDGSGLAAVAIAGSGTAIIPCACLTALDLSPLHSEVLVRRPPYKQDGEQLWVVPLLGGSPRRVGDLRADYATWSPDGRQLAFTRRNGLYISNADGSGARQIARIRGQARWPGWSPDGSTLRFTENSYRTGEVRESIWEVAADGSNLHRLLDGWNNPPHECCGTWTPDGRFYVFQATREGRTDLWALSERRGLFGRSSRLPVRLSSGLEGFASPTVSSDGKHVFALGMQKRGELVRYDFRLREFVPFLGGISATWVSFSRSGGSVAYIDYRDLTIWRASADGSNKKQITFSPLQADGFSWSPDEKWLAVRARTPGKTWKIYMVPSQGGEPQLLMPGKAEQGVPVWSADGRRIAFGDVPAVFGKAKGTEVIHILDLNTHTLSELPGSRGLWTVRWSPDGRTLAALTISGQRLMLFDVATKRWRATRAENVDNPTWSEDGRYIYFDTGGADRALRRLRVADGNVAELVSLRNYQNLAWWWSGVTPDNSPMILRNIGETEVYALTLEPH